MPLFRMFRLIIQTVANSVLSILRFVLSAKFLTTVTFSFLFFVSIGAAEEKHVSFCNVLSLCIGEEQQASAVVFTSAIVHV